MLSVFFALDPFAAAAFSATASQFQRWKSMSAVPSSVNWTVYGIEARIASSAPFVGATPPISVSLPLVDATFVFVATFHSSLNENQTVPNRAWANLGAPYHTRPYPARANLVKPGRTQPSTLFRIPRAVIEQHAGIQTRLAML